MHQLTGLDRLGCRDLEIAHELNSLEHVGNEQISSAASVFKKNSDATSGNQEKLGFQSKSVFVVAAISDRDYFAAGPAAGKDEADPARNLYLTELQKASLQPLETAEAKVMSRSRIFRYKGGQIIHR